MKLLNKSRTMRPITIPSTTTTIFLLFVLAPIISHSLPLSSSSRWIVDEQSGERVKLSCANWAGHLEPMLPEGLDKRPLSQIASHVSSMGFNCVRLTWATYMYTRQANMTVLESFNGLGLTEAVNGLAQYNPNLLGLSLVEARKAVVEEIGKHGIMMVLDNHVSKPMWCCGGDDGNGFFGSVYFDPEEWLQGLTMVANIFKDTPMVIGMSLRNELRGPLQNVDVWYKYIEKGAKTINTAHPSLLVIISGLNYDLDFRFLKQRPLNLDTMKNKLVYETHRYVFSEGQSKVWMTRPLNKVCYNMTQEMDDKEGFLVRGNDNNNVAPLFVSEFGINQMGESEADNLHLPCMLSYLADLDLDWSVWALQGSYYLRDGHHGPDETYGMLNTDWTAPRNPDFLSKLQFLQQKLQDPKSSEPTYQLLYHPLTGKCARVEHDEVFMSDCLRASKCTQEADGMPIKIVDSPNYCLTAAEEDLPVAVSAVCGGDNTWTLASNYSMLQLASKGLHEGVLLCLDFDSSYSPLVLTRKCVGLEEGDMRNPQTQWFKLIASNNVAKL